MVNTICNYKKFEVCSLTQNVECFLDSLLFDFDLNNKEINVILCDNKMITEYNSTYRGKEGPTDVLSFSQTEGEEFETHEDIIPLGDIIISVEKAVQQSHEYDVSFPEELARLAIHGTLHLLGYDHENSESDAIEMFKVQDEYLDKFITLYYPD